MIVLYTLLDSEREHDLAAQPVEQAPPRYRDRLARMRSRPARARTQAGLWLLAYGLRALGHDESAIAGIGFAVHGRPEIAHAPAFSISHSGALVACAIATGTQAVGLDVEARRDRVPARLTRLLDAGERERVNLAPQRFFDFWCAREATVKASGRVGLARIRALTLHDGHARLDGRDWPLQSLELVPGHAACLASDGPIPEVIVRACTIGAHA